MKKIDTSTKVIHWNKDTKDKNCKICQFYNICKENNKLVNGINIIWCFDFQLKNGVEL